MIHKLIPFRLVIIVILAVGGAAYLGFVDVPLAAAAGGLAPVDTVSAQETDPYAGEEIEGVLVEDVTWTSDSVIVEFEVTDDNTPVEVQYADIGGSIQGEAGIRQPQVESEALISPGTHEVEIPAENGEAGQIATMTVEGQPVTLEGDGTQAADRGLIQHLDPTPALILGSVAGLSVAALVAYRQRTDELEKPIKASEVWNRK